MWFPHPVPNNEGLDGDGCPLSVIPVHEVKAPEITAFHPNSQPTWLSYTYLDINGFCDMGSVGSSSGLSEKNMMSGVFRRVYYCVSFKLEIEPRASCVLGTAQLLYQMNESSCSCLLIRTEAMPYRCFWQGNICLMYEVMLR